MLSKFVNKARALSRINLGARLDHILMNQGRMWTKLSALAPEGSLQDYEFKVFSQWGEDGIIQRLIDLVPIANRTFVEFGVEDFSESNCRFLLMNDNWRGFVIDGDDENIARLTASYYFWMYDLQAKAAFIDPDNINALLESSGFSSDLGILSVDIDGIDYWVLNAIKSYRPRILITEYNAVFGSDRAVTVPLDPSFVRSQAHHSNLYFGASLAAYQHFAEQNGYLFVGTNTTGSNAFFVRKDVASPAVERLASSAAFTPSLCREARKPDGSLALIGGEERLSAIQDMPVINVVTGAEETL